jgi:hypothetical protein
VGIRQLARSGRLKEVSEVGDRTPKAGQKGREAPSASAVGGRVQATDAEKAGSGRNQTLRVAITRIGGASDLFGSSAVLARGVARMTLAYEGGNVVELKEIRTRKQANEATRQIRASCGHEQK